MVQFRYKALDASGASQKGEIEAASEGEALSRLQGRALEAYELTRLPPQLTLGARARITPADRALFVRQLATLLEAGVGILDALTSLSRSRAHEGLAGAAGAIAKDLRAGQRLSASLPQHLPGLPVYVPRLAELGEATGQSAQALNDAADRMEFEAGMRAEIRTALAYPTFLAVVGTVLVMALFVFVVPRFDDLLGDRIDNVPAFSRVVMSLGRGMADNLLVLGIGLLAVVLVAVRIRRSEVLKGRLRQRLERVPGVGPTLIRADLGGWARTVGIALSNGADLLSALRLGEDGVRSPRIRAALSVVRSDVRTGTDLERALGDNIPDFDPLTLDLVRTGRMSGRLAEMLLFVGRGEEETTRRRAKRFAALAEPVAILLISLVVGAIVISIVLAMTSAYDFDI